MLYKATCIKCGAINWIDGGDKSKDECELELFKMKTCKCVSGNHEECMSPLQLFNIDWEHPIEVSQDAPITDDSVRDAIMKMYNNCYTREELEKEFEIESFAFGACLVSNKKNGMQAVFNFKDGPTKRFYFTTDLGGVNGEA